MIINGVVFSTKEAYNWYVKLPPGKNIEFKISFGRIFEMNSLS